VAGWEVADVQRNTGEPHRRKRLSLREESFGDATLIEHFNGARVKPPGSRSVNDLAGAGLDDDDVDPRQRQLARQHHPGWATAGDHH
jgi:hypothetical protein